MRKHAVIYGATGFVGRGLATQLAEQGYEITGVSRKGSGDVRGVSRWVTPDVVDFGDCDLVVNLAGEPVDQRWTEATKKSLRDSRVGVTEEIVRRIGGLPAERRPKVLLNASAVGYYGGRGDEMLDEESSPGTGYLAELCADWENAAAEAESLGMRVVGFRTGVVLGKGGQAFEKLVTVFKAGIGGRLGNGRQWMPWIHVDDLRRAMIFCLLKDTVTGPVNGTAPKPERNVDFTRKLAKSLKRWVFLPVPAFVLKIVLGGFASALLEGQRALPKKLESAGFEFKYRELEQALDDLTA